MQSSWPCSYSVSYFYINLSKWVYSGSKLSESILGYELVNRAVFNKFGLFYCFNIILELSSKSLLDWLLNEGLLISKYNPLFFSFYLLLGSKTSDGYFSVIDLEYV